MVTVASIIIMHFLVLEFMDGRVKAGTLNNIDFQILFYISLVLSSIYVYYHYLRNYEKNPLLVLDHL